MFDPCLLYPRKRTLVERAGYSCLPVFDHAFGIKLTPQRPRGRMQISGKNIEDYRLELTGLEHLSQPVTCLHVSLPCPVLRLIIRI